MGIGSLGGLGDRTGRANTRLTTFLTPGVSVTSTGSVLTPGSTVTILSSTPAEMLVCGFAWNFLGGVPTGPTSSILRLYAGDQVRINGGNTACGFDSQGNFYWYEANLYVIKKMAAGSRQVTVFFGNGTNNNTNGTGTGGAISNPVAMAFDGADNMYLAVQGSAWRGVKVISPAGVMTTLAGSATVAADLDATGTAAQFANVSGICLDNTGNVYVSNAATPKLRKITSGGVVTSFAGTGTAGYADGPGASATFNNAYRLAWDATTNTIVVGDRAKIRRVALDGTVSTVVGNGTAAITNGAVASAQTKNAYAVAVLPNGDIVFAEVSDSQIRKISGGQVSTISGTTGYAAGLMDHFNYQYSTQVSYAFALHPSGTYVVGPESTQSNRYRYHEVSGSNGYAGTFVGDNTAGNVLGVQEIPVAETIVNAMSSSVAGYFYTPNVMFPAPVRVPAGTRLSVINLVMDASTGFTINLRAIVGYPGNFE